MRVTWSLVLIGALAGSPYPSGGGAQQQPCGPAWAAWTSPGADLVFGLPDEATGPGDLTRPALTYPGRPLYPDRRLYGCVDVSEGVLR